MELAIGIDIGFSTDRRSTGVIIMDRATKTLATGSRPLVATARDVVSFVDAELTRLGPSHVIAVVDGPFAGAKPPAKSRQIERFFTSGPFASAPPNGGAHLRVMSAPTAVGSPFLASTRAVVDALVSAGLDEAKLTDVSVVGNVIEIFPTIFMVALLTPHAYAGGRSDHSDDLWEKLIGVRMLGGAKQICPAISPPDAHQRLGTRESARSARSSCGGDISNRRGLVCDVPTEQQGSVSFNLRRPRRGGGLPVAASSPLQSHVHRTH